MAKQKVSKKKKEVKEIVKTETVTTEPTEMLNAITRGYEYCPNCKAFTMIPVEGKGNRVQCMTCGYWTRIERRGMDWEKVQKSLEEAKKKAETQ